MSKLAAARATRDETAASVADAIRAAEASKPPPASPSEQEVALTAPAAALEDELIRVGITMPRSLYDAVGDMQEALRKSRRRVSVSALFEVAMNELLTRDLIDVLAAAHRYGASPRRDGRRK